MKTSIIKTATYFFLIMPFTLVFAIWEILPEQIIIYFPIFGQESVQEKWWIILIVAIFTLGAYGIFVLVATLFKRSKPDSDVFPNYLTFRLILLSVLSIYSCLIVIQSVDLINTTSNFAYIVSGCIILILGFIFPLLPPNYFIGVRTKWTLSNKNVWKKTHNLSRFIWILAGSIIIALSFIYSREKVNIFYFIILFLAAIIPIAYSYFIYNFIKSRN